MPEVRLRIEAQHVRKGDHLQLKGLYHPHAATVRDVVTKDGRTSIDITVLKEAPWFACYHAREAAVVLRWEES